MVTRSRGLALFAVALLLLGGVAVRQERADADLRRQGAATLLAAERIAAALHETCLLRNENIRRLNAQNKALLDAELADTPHGSAEAKARRVAIYGTVLSPFECEVPDLLAPLDYGR